jgi:hypothetical protein
MEPRCLKTVRPSFHTHIGAQRPAITGLPHSSPFPYDTQTLIHFILPILRILFLIILFFALTNPVVTYTRVTSADEVREDQPTSTSHLLSTQEHGNPASGLGLTVRSTYGTLDETTNSPARTPSPGASDHEASKIKVHIYTLFQVGYSFRFHSRRLRRRRRTTLNQRLPKY